MTGYEQELRKLFENSGLIDRPQFSGRVCVGELGKDLRVRAELFSAHVAADYDAIRLAVLNRTEGVVDKTLVRFEDVWGKRIVPGNPNFRSGVIPHLRSDYGELDWYGYHPDAADYDILRQAIQHRFSLDGTLKNGILIGCEFTRSISCLSAPNVSGCFKLIDSRADCIFAFSIDIAES